MSGRFAKYLEKRKADIIIAVLRLVDRVGVNGVTTKRIAVEVGVAEGALYKHFKSKSGIFLRILEVTELQLQEEYAGMAARRLGPDQWLADLFQFLAAYLEEFPGLYRTVFSDALYTGDSALRQRFRTTIHGLKESAEQAIRAGVAAGMFRPGLDPHTSAIMYLGVVDTSFTLWSLFEERCRGLAEVARPLFAEYMNSLRREPASAITAAPPAFPS
jgi:AcrR family transcriptional regulator